MEINICDSRPRPSKTKSLYLPLQRGQIRLLKILPGLEKDKVHCQLRTECLVTISAHNAVTKPTYTAISYTWGDLEKPKVTVIVNGHELRVTQNCDLVLRELRREAIAQSKTPCFWIDAICVNQDDIPERNQQILLMLNVYQLAEKLVVWLGPEAEGSDEAIEILKELASSASRSSSGFIEWAKCFREHSRYEERWFCIARFFSRSWFRRQWVIQEYQAILNRTDPMFYCGKTRVGERVLLDFITKKLDKTTSMSFYMTFIRIGRTDLKRLLLESFVKGIVSFTSMQLGTYVTANDLLIKPGAETANRLLARILVSSECQSSDPRDRIYAHIGLTQNDKMIEFVKHINSSFGSGMRDLKFLMFSAYHDLSETDSEFYASNLIIDYSKPIEDVYSSLVRFIVVNTKRLDILSLCWRGSYHAKRTWTIDLTKHSMCEVGGILQSPLYFPDSKRICRASKHSSAIATFSYDLSVLSVKGIHLATVGVGFGPRRRKPKEGYLEMSVFAHKAVIQRFLKLLEKNFETREAARKALWMAWIDKAFWGPMSADLKIYQYRSDSKNDDGNEAFYGPRLEDYQKWSSWIDTQDGEDDSKTDRVLQMWRGYLAGQPHRDLFIAEEYLGRGWKTVRKGDIICLILGCDVPLVLRPVEDYYELVGDCYIDGIMCGEGMKAYEDGTKSLMTFDLH